MCHNVTLCVITCVTAGVSRPAHAISLRHTYSTRAIRQDISFCSGGAGKNSGNARSACGSRIEYRRFSTG